MIPHPVSSLSEYFITPRSAPNWSNSRVWFSSRGTWVWCVVKTHETHSNHVVTQRRRMSNGAFPNEHKIVAGHDAWINIRVICKLIHLALTAPVSDSFTPAVLSEMTYSSRRAVERIRQAFITADRCMLADRCMVSTSIWSFIRFITSLI